MALLHIVSSFSVASYLGPRKLNGLAQGISIATWLTHVFSAKDSFCRENCCVMRSSNHNEVWPLYLGKSSPLTEGHRGARKRKQSLLCLARSPDEPWVQPLTCPWERSCRAAEGVLCCVCAENFDPQIVYFDGGCLFPPSPALLAHHKGASRAFVLIVTQSPFQVSSEEENRKSSISRQVPRRHM